MRKLAVQGYPIAHHLCQPRQQPQNCFLPHTTQKPFLPFSCCTDANFCQAERTRSTHFGTMMFFTLECLSSYAKALLTKESSQIHKQELSSEDVINIFLYFNLKKKDISEKQPDLSDILIPLNLPSTSPKVCQQKGESRHTREGLLSSYQHYPERLTVNLRLKIFNSTRRLLLIARASHPT